MVDRSRSSGNTFPFTLAINVRDFLASLSFPLTNSQRGDSPTKLNVRRKTASNQKYCKRKKACVNFLPFQTQQRVRKWQKRPQFTVSSLWDWRTPSLYHHCMHDTEKRRKGLTWSTRSEVRLKQRLVQSTTSHNLWWHRQIQQPSCICVENTSRSHACGKKCWGFPWLQSATLCDQNTEAVLFFMCTKQSRLPNAVSNLKPNAKPASVSHSSRLDHWNKQDIVLSKASFFQMEWTPVFRAYEIFLLCNCLTEPQRGFKKRNLQITNAAKKHPVAPNPITIREMTNTM